MKSPLLCIKLGGSVITDKKIPYSIRTTIVKNIAAELKKIKKPLLICHGSGSFGHTSAQKYGGKHGYSSQLGIATVARDAMAINKAMIDIFIDAGLPAVSFRPQSFLLAENGRLKESFLSSLYEALAHGLIPVVYGDVIWDTKWKSTIFSGETTLHILCGYLKKFYEITRIIEFCDVDGVLDVHNHEIPQITTKNWNEVKKHIFEDGTTDITGGMKHKVERALTSIQLGIQTIITNGNKRECVKKALNGHAVGTTITF